jgi:sec-independent protein translocase protein TatA
MNSLALLPNLAGPDGLIILMIILLLFGAKKLPELARGLGSAVREFSKAKDDIQSEMMRPPVEAPRIESPREEQQQPQQVAGVQQPTTTTVSGTPTHHA